MSIQNKIVIISGASGGLGQTVSREFHRAGAAVVLLGSRTERVQPLADELGTERALPLGADLTNPAEAERVVAATLDKFGRVDVLLNLAGGFDGGQPVHQTDAAVLQKMFAMNLHTAYNLSRAVAPAMTAQQWGRIVNTGSRDALKARAKFSAYAMSKAALLRLTESMADELKPYHITVNAILPGTIDTPANRKAMPNADFSTWVKPATIAHALFFLCAENSATTGATIPLFEQL